MLGVNSVAATLRSILPPNGNISNELSTALMSLGSSIDQIRNKQDSMAKDIELVRKLARSNWLLIINLPLPFGVSKIQAVQNLFSSLGYTKPLFDADRDLLATDLIYVNKNGLLCNMSIFVAQRHYDYVMSAPFQKAIMDHNRSLGRGMSILAKGSRKVRKRIKKDIPKTMYQKFAGAKVLSKAM
ncbi:unnamed protein product [Cylicostephanus goldi]|uniref:Uncharacterized protein n=1 Tax=Cylicostephanus goldi TaxID=71465 RepID=A0A3P6UZ48_CYLGO|nr:unnamed protein product [Cylicostephanus goldi]